MSIQKNLAKAKKFVGKNTVLPVLENIVISTTDARVTNLNNTYVFSHDIPVKGTGYIPFDFFEKAVTKLKTIDSIEFNEGNVIILSGKTTVKCYVKDSLDDFPELPSGDILSKGKITLGKDFKIAQNFAIKKCDGTYHIALPNVLIDTNYIVGTDAHTLCYLPTNNDVPVKFMLPPTSFFLEGDFHYNLYSNFIELYNENEVFYFNLPDGVYPEYPNVIPHDNPNVYEFDRKELIDALGVLALGYNPTTKAIVFNGGKFTSCDLGLSNEVTVEVSCTLIEGEFIDYSVNGEFLMKILKSIPDDIIIWECSASNRGSLINTNYLIMPLLYNKY